MPDKMLATRDGFGQALLELGVKNQDVVVLTADLAESTRAEAFGQKWPERFVEVGVAEQNLVGVAAGLAVSGKIPFATSYSVFSPGRSWDQIRVSVCYNQANVKIVGSHAGLTVGPDGATHQALEDIAMTRVLPHLTVLVPADAEEARQATLAAAAHQGPVYLRLGREPVPAVTKPDSKFYIGKARVMRAGKDVTVVTCGTMVSVALEAARQFATENGPQLEVLNLHTIKPLDIDTIAKSLHKTGILLTLEEHQVAGGLGSAVLEGLVAKGIHLPAKIKMMGMNDQFGQSGTAAELLEKYGLHPTAVKKQICRLIK